MPKHVARPVRGALSRASGGGRAPLCRVGVKVRSGLWLVSGLGLACASAIASGPALAVTPLNTYLGPGLPLNDYFPDGIPGQADEPGVTVLTRARPDYDPLGIRAGAFMIRPSLDEEAGYDTNVVGGLVDGKASSELVSSAGVNINSDYSRNNIGISAGIANSTYFDLPRFDQTSYNASVGGALNLGRDTLNGSISYLNAYENPYDIGAIGQGTQTQLNSPLNFSDTDFRVSYDTTFGRFTITPNVDYQLFRFASGDFLTFNNGVITNNLSGGGLDQRLRDRNVLQGGFIGRYEFAPGRDVVVVVNGNYDHYSNNPPPDIGAVDNTGATALGGIDYQVSGLITVRALVGYQERFFNGNKYGNQGAPIGEADITWNPTGLTTLRLAYSRTIEDATTDSVTGYTYDRFSGIVDHELYRNILLQGNVHVEKAEYQGANYTQTNYGGGGGVTYLMNRNVQLSLSYDFTEQDSTGVGGGSFGRHEVFLHAKFGI